MQQTDNPNQSLICVFGLGQSGLSAARYLDRTGQPFFVVDTREHPPGENEITLLRHCHASYFGVIPQGKINAARYIILSPGVALSHSAIKEAQQRGVKIVGDIELFVSQTRAKIVAITGSNGKSTVTDLCHRLLTAAGVNAKIGGNFGVPVLDYLPADDTEVYVLEVSSFQLDTTESLKADVAVLLNVSEDHMDRYASFDAYRDSKLRIYQGAKNIIANADDSATLIGLETSAKLFSLTRTDCALYVDNQIVNGTMKSQLMVNHQAIVSVDQLTLQGRHNWSNALVALGILDALNIPLDKKIVTSLTAYAGLEHRFQKVGVNSQYEWINDSKATNVGATVAALESVDIKKFAPIILIAGGDAKGADLSGLKPILADKVTRLILIGKDAALFQPLMAESKTEFTNDMLGAVKAAKNYLDNQLVSDAKKPMVLLSPACASLDMFKNYQARGQAFIDAIHSLQEAS